MGFNLGFKGLSMLKILISCANWCRLYLTLSGWAHSKFMTLKNGIWIHKFTDTHTHTHTYRSQADGPVGVTEWLREGNITVQAKSTEHNLLGAFAFKLSLHSKFLNTSRTITAYLALPARYFWIIETDLCTRLFSIGCQGGDCSHNFSIFYIPSC